MLDHERRYFDEHLPEWLSRYPGKFVVIKNDEILGIFDSFDDALAEGARRLGLQSFLVRRIEPVQATVHIPALTLGLLNAGSERPVRG